MIKRPRLLLYVATSVVILSAFMVMGTSRQTYATGTVPPGSNPTPQPGGGSVPGGCSPSGKILGIIPTWYAYLATDDLGCPVINEPKDFVLIPLAILDALMRVAAILSVVFIVIGGIKYTASQGTPDATKNAKDTIVNAIIGLVITVLASAAIAFVARVLG